jgi:hypothetical protein
VLIESNLILDKITTLMNEAEESQLNFTSYKAVTHCLKILLRFIYDLEIDKAEDNVLRPSYINPKE